ncbi:hypothetical protein ACPCHQ_22200 [Ralstonia thomasii]|uniref:hypothetical protein n=1 Tax=Ralstonia thomasii TaxID=3058596 RepID=UPI003C2D6ABB
MQKITILALATLAMVASQVAEAGRGGGGGSSGGRSSISSGRSSSVASSRPSAPYRAASANPSRNSTPGARNLGTRRSLLASGQQPSPQLSQIIRERESSGPGWLGTAFLISLLSRHDLSEADHQWLESKINALKDEDDQEPELVPAVVPEVRFAYTGLQSSFAIDQAATIRVSAKADDGKPVTVACAMPEAEITQDDGSAAIKWRPQAAAVYVLTCRAGTQRDRRILKAGT